MAYRSMREFIAALEQHGKLRRIAQKIDRLWEPACLAKWMYQALPNDRRFGLLFENVAGSDIPLATGLLGASVEAYALALGVEPAGINDKWVHAILNRIPPVTVQEASCQQVVHVGEDVRLSDLPIPVWTPGKDVGPYITTNMLTRDATTGAQGTGVYRTQVRDDRSVIVNLSPGRQSFARTKSYTDQGKPAPIAWVITAEPAVHLASVANLPYGIDEIDVAGGLIGEPIQMVKAKTIDLMVPANAEIIIEGEVMPGEFEMEGPFGEFAGYMGPVGKKPVARITAITHRRNPIYYGYTSQMPPSESTVIQSLTNAGVILKMLRHDHGELGVSDVHIDLTFGGLLAHVIVAMTTQLPEDGKRIGRLVADMTALKRVTVVDSDIDIRDPLHLEWAMNSRFNPARDTIIIDDVYFPMHMDPSVRPAEGKMALGSKLVLDATQKVDAGTFSLPSKEYMMRALDLWKTLGLPEFDIPRRAQLRIDRS
jgi:4-hydroxy-3-polyprenylbenzoate decarboxylase